MWLSMAPLFWLWHTFVDEVKQDWFFKRWQMPAPIPLLGTVPDLRGISLTETFRLLATFGLGVRVSIMSPQCMSQPFGCMHLVERTEEATCRGPAAARLQRGGPGGTED